MLTEQLTHWHMMWQTAWGDLAAWKWHLELFLPLNQCTEDYGLTQSSLQAGGYTAATQPVITRRVGNKLCKPTIAKMIPL